MIGKLTKYLQNVQTPEGLSLDKEYQLFLPQMAKNVPSLGSLQWCHIL